MAIASHGSGHIKTELHYKLNDVIQTAHCLIN